MGYFFSVRKSLLEQWECVFDENLSRYAYAEDLDFTARYCMKAHEENLNCIIDPRLYVNHIGSQEWRTPTAEAAKYFVVNRRYLAKKIYPKRKRYIVAMNIWDTLFAYWCKDKQYSRAIKNSIKEYKNNPTFFDEVQNHLI